MCSRGSISLSGKRLSRKIDNVVVFPFVFYIAAQQPFKPLWSRLLLYELESSWASFALCFKSLLMTLIPASVVVSLFVWRLPFDLSSKGGPASSYATAGIALRVTGVLKPPHHDKVEHLHSLISPIVGPVPPKLPTPVPVVSHSTTLLWQSLLPEDIHNIAISINLEHTYWRFVGTTLHLRYWLQLQKLMN
jgi:hypothetical protein